MLLAPAITGGLLAGFGWQNWLLLLAWVTAYLAFVAVRGVIGGRHKPAYLTAAVVYGVVAVALIIVLLTWRWALAWWGIPLAVLLGGSMALIATGHERSAVNDACLIGASALMTAISATCLQTVAWPTAWLVTAVMAGYFLGTIPYVKTMIRERGSTRWYIGSVAYHIVLVALACLTLNGWLIAFSVLIAARAGVVPKVWPRAKPKYIGIAEVIGTVIIMLIAWLTIA